MAWARRASPCIWRGRRAAAFPDGVVFVPLAPVRDPTLVLPVIAQALWVREGSLPLAVTLAHALRDRHLLLVLDNCEQIIAAAPALPSCCSPVRT